MFIYRFGFPAGLLMFPDDGGGGDAGGGGNTGGDAGSSQNGGTSSTNTETPNAIDINDDALIRVKGSDKPVKFGDHVKGFQAQFTRASQEAARLKQQLQVEQQKRQEYERRVQQASGGNQSQNRQGQSEDLYAKLEALPYLDGKTAAQTIKGIGEQIQQRDMVLLAALNKMQQMQQTLAGLNQNHVNSNFEGKISKWVDEVGVPREALDWAKELYLAYEGDDLDQEFPRILKERWDLMNRVVNSQRETAARKAKEARMFVPGKGGNAGPNSPLQLKGNESAKDLADKLWNQFGDSDT